MARQVRYVVWAVLVSAVVLEILAGLWTGKNRYEGKELGTNLFIFGTNRFLRGCFGGWAALCLEPFYELAPLRLPLDGTGFVVALLLTDFIYYWQHRLVHRSRWLWPFHGVHHTSRTLNLAAAGRLSWFNFLVMPFFLIPLALAGVAPKLIALSMFLNLAWQFFLHSPWIGRLGVLEGIVNTPSAHRVHHATNRCYRGRNFGGLLVIWDRLFGTYGEERPEEAPRFGLPGQVAAFDPFRAQLEPFAAWRSAGSVDRAIKKKTRRAEERS